MLVGARRDGNEALVTVRDTGRKASPTAERERIFERSSAAAVARATTNRGDRVWG